MQLWAPSLGLSVLHMVTHCPNEIPVFLFVFKLILSQMSVEKLRTSVVKLDNCSFWNINHEEWNCEHFQMTTSKLKNNHVVEKCYIFYMQKTFLETLILGRIMSLQICDVLVYSSKEQHLCKTISFSCNIQTLSRHCSQSIYIRLHMRYIYLS